jgi:hypothetical protein
MITHDILNRAQLAAAWHYSRALARAENFAALLPGDPLEDRYRDTARMFARLGRDLASAECGTSYTFTMSPERP